MIHVWVAMVVTVLVSLVAFIFGGAIGKSLLEDGLLKEGFLVDCYKSKNAGQGHYVLYRRNALGKWVEVKNIE
jgi:hypothetical protein